MMKRSDYILLISFLLLVWDVQAQEKALDIVVGAIYPIRTDNKAGDAKPKTGLSFGLLYRKKNEKGDLWSLSAAYQLLQNKSKVLVNNREETQTEKYEMFQVAGFPITWWLGKKQRGFIEAGAFVQYLLHQETQLQGNVVNDTKTLQRTSLGPSLGIGIQLGESLRKSLIIGLRDDYSAVSFGKGPNGGKAIPLKFNTITLYVGIGI